MVGDDGLERVDARSTERATSRSSERLLAAVAELSGILESERVYVEREGDVRSSLSRLKRAIALAQRELVEVAALDDTTSAIDELLEDARWLDIDGVLPPPQSD